jgi:hypothetical protein
MSQNLYVANLMGTKTSQAANDSMTFGVGGSGGNFFVDANSTNQLVLGYNTAQYQGGGTSRVQVYNNSTNRNPIFAINTAGTTGGADSVMTKNNTLDDGSGNMAVSSNVFAVNGVFVGATNYNSNSNNVYLGYDSGSGNGFGFLRSTKQGVAWTPLRLNDVGGGLYSQNSTLDDGSGNATFAGDVTAYSDARLKEDVATLQGASELVKKLRGVSFRRKDTGKRGVGLIAQEVQEHLPQVVHERISDDNEWVPNSKKPEGPTLALAYGNMVGLLVECLKDVLARLERIEEREGPA